MFDPCLKSKTVRVSHDYENWEADIDSVEIEPCHEHEDPLGCRVVFYQGEAALRAAGRKYVIGASFLKKRLESLSKAGFDAPMTMQAIRMVEKNLCCTLF